MADSSAIAWTKSTFNPWIGCTKIGPGCDACYAERLDNRMQFGGGTHWGAGVPRYRTKPANWAKPLAWNKNAPDSEFAGIKGFWPVFCASLADVFDNEVHQDWRDDLWKLIEATPNLSWLIVTKRIGNVASMVPPGWMYGFPPQVRLLITVCNQEEADRDVHRLLALPCNNGISYEPALELVDWTNVFSYHSNNIPVFRNVLEEDPIGRHVQWIIVGGESSQPPFVGRAFSLNWARRTVWDTFKQDVPCFVKQLGSNPYNGRQSAAIPLDLKDRAGSDLLEWPAELRIQQFPT